MPLVVCNGQSQLQGALDPLEACLDHDTTLVRFDVPGTGDSPDSPLPYGFRARRRAASSQEAWFDGKMDVSGFVGRAGSAVRVQNPRRCRRLIWFHRHRCSHGSWRACGAEDADPAPLLGFHDYASVIAGRSAAALCAPPVPHQAVVRPPADGRFAGELPSSTACWAVWTSLFALR